MTLQDLNGQVALITGATSGIGRAIAERLAGHGVKLALAARSKADPIVPGALQGEVDVADSDAMEQFANDVISEFGKIDIVIPNAGVGHYAAFLDTPTERVDEMIQTNFVGTVNTVRAALPHMIERNKGGDIVSVASEAGRRGLAGEAAYSGSKFGQLGFIRAMDHELRPHGIRTTNLCPGGVETAFAVGDGRGRTEGSDQLAGMMKADDIADLAEYVLTRPRRYRILEVALRPMTEESWG